MKATMSIIGVFLAGGAGSVLRFGIARLSAFLFPFFPAGTLVANLVGSFLIGLFAVWFIDREILASPWRETLIVGFLGGLTTFSSFNHDSYVLLSEGRWLALASYVLANLAIGFGLTLTGRALGNL